MEQLIKLSEGGFPVNSLELYNLLGLDNTHYARWTKKYILNNIFALKEIDFQAIPIMVLRKGGKKPIGQFGLTISFAKKLCMMSHSKNGEVARDYFIACEKTALEVIKPTLPQNDTSISVIPKTFSEALYLAYELAKQNEGQQLLIEQAKPKVDGYNQFLQIPNEAISIKLAAKLLNVYCKDNPKQLMGQNLLFKYLRSINVLQSNNLPYQQHSEYFIVKEILKQVYKQSGELETKVFKMTLITPKGLEKLRKRMIKDNFKFKSEL